MLILIKWFLKTFGELNYRLMNESLIVRKPANQGKTESPALETPAI